MTQLPVYQFDSSQFSILNFFSSTIVFSPTTVWIFIALVGIVFIILSLVLSYHWKRFGIDMWVMGRASILYFSVSAFLWVIMIASLAFYLSSL